MSYFRRAVFGLIALAIWVSPLSAGSQEKPGKRLWDRAQQAMQAGKFDVANVTLHTLINTYPNSKYAAGARKELMDPRILATCGQGFMTSCDEEQLAASRKK